MSLQSVQGGGKMFGHLPLWILKNDKYFTRKYCSTINLLKNSGIHNYEFIQNPLNDFFKLVGIC